MQHRRPDIWLLSYATAGPYAQEMARLQRSAAAVGWPAERCLFHTLPGRRAPDGPDAQARRSRESAWLAAVRDKPAILLRAILLGRLPLLFVDADAVLHQDPRPLLEEIIADNPRIGWAAHRYADREICSGSLFFWDRPIAEQVVGRWKGEDFTAPNLHQPQRVLQRLIDSGAVPPPALLPETLCYINALAKTAEPPIIEHLQASRQYRRGEAGELLDARLQRIREIETASPQRTQRSQSFVEGGIV